MIDIPLCKKLSWSLNEMLILSFELFLCCVQIFWFLILFLTATTTAWIGQMVWCGLYFYVFWLFQLVVKLSEFIWVLFSSRNLIFISMFFIVSLFCFLLESRQILWCGSYLHVFDCLNSRGSEMLAILSIVYDLGLAFIFGSVWFPWLNYLDYWILCWY